MSLYKFISKNSEQTIQFGFLIGKYLLPGDVILLTGDLGAGKTTFTKGVGSYLGVKRVINSPTFTIVKEYKGNLNLYHLDLYRLDGVGEDFDLEEYFYKDGISVIEWPFQARDLLPDEYIIINIKNLSDNEREISLDSVGKRYEGRFNDVKFDN